MSEQPAVFDRVAMMENFAGDADLFREIAQIFLDDAPQQLAGLDAAYASGDLEQLRAAAHKLKGSVASFAATDAHAAGKALEQACKDQRREGLPAQHAELKRQTERLVAALRAELAA